MDAVRLLVASCLPDPSFARPPALDSRHPALSAGTDDDRISSLPSTLLSNIVARLPIKDAVRTTALSHRWRRVWPSTPLVLDDRDLLPSSEQRLVSVVSRVFLTHPGPFLSVRLTLGFMGFHHPEVEFWPRVLAGKGVRQLVWINHPPPVDLRLSAGVFRCASLRVLYLGFWKLPNLGVDLPQHQQHVLFPLLEELVICHCDIDSINLALMLKHSPLLSKLSFVSSYGTPELVEIQKSTLKSLIFWCSSADGLIVQGSPCLRRLIMWNASAVSTLARPMKVEIDSASPSLTVVGYLEPGVHKLQIGDALIGPHTKASRRTMVPSVKVLALRVHWVKNLVNMMPSFLRCFPNVETLHIESGKEDGVPVGNLNWLCARLVNCITRLKTLVFHEFKGGRSEISFLKLVAEHGYQLQKLVILLSSECLLSVKDAKLKVDSVIGCAQWANADCELFFCTFKEPGAGQSFTFQEASDLTLRDPFFELPSM